VAPLSTNAVELLSKTKGLTVGEWVIREAHSDVGEGATWKFQVILRNESRGCFENVDCEFRYFDMAGKFVGVDEELSLWADYMKQQEDMAVSIPLTIPPTAARAVFTAKAKRTSFLQKHGDLLFGAIILISALIFTIGQFLKK